MEQPVSSGHLFPCETEIPATFRSHKNVLGEIKTDYGRMQLPWATPAGGLDFVKKKTKEVVRAAGLRDELSFTSFRHGGLTELGDADLTDTQIRALSRQKSSKVLPRYIKRTRRQIVAGTVKRRALRETKNDD